MTLNKTEQKIFNALARYQNEGYEDLLRLKGLSGPLTGLFFSLVDILERGQDELPRSPRQIFDDELGARLAQIKGQGSEPKPEPIRMSAANSSEISKAYITGTKDGLAVASRLVERTFENRDIELGMQIELVANISGELRDEYLRAKKELASVRGTITAILTEETNRTEKAQEAK